MGYSENGMRLASPSSQLQSLQMQTLQRYGSRLNYATWRKNATRVARKLLFGCKQCISCKFVVHPFHSTAICGAPEIGFISFYVAFLSPDIFPPFIDITSISDSRLFSSFAFSIYRYCYCIFFSFGRLKRRSRAASADWDGADYEAESEG